MTEKNCTACEGTGISRPILALTLWPEWAWAICNLTKRVENRSRGPDKRLKPGDWFAIHAGAHLGGRKGKPAHYEALTSLQVMAERAEYHTEIRAGALHVGSKGTRIKDHRLDIPGACRRHIVALARYQYSGENNPSRWATTGAVSWQLGARIIRVPRSIRLSGKQGLWVVPEEHQAYLRSLIR